MGGSGEGRRVSEVEFKCIRCGEEEVKNERRQ